MIKTSLQHHGIKGMHWGIRRGPPYPIEDKVLRKGTKLNSVAYTRDSEAYRKAGKWLYTYNPNDEWDSKVYRGPFAVYKQQSSFGGMLLVSEHQYEVVKDLKMPTSKERIDEFIKIYSKKKVQTIKDLSQVQKVMKNINLGTKEAQNVDLWNMKTDQDYKLAYEILNHAMEASHRFKTTKAYSKVMSKKYDAMVDDNNQGIYNNAHDPIIIFRANQALKTIGPARVIDVQEVKDNYDYIKKVQGKVLL